MDFLLSGGALPLAVAGLVLAFGVCAAVASRPGRSGLWWRVLARLLWGASVVGVCYLTLWLANPAGGGVNLVPLDTIRRQLAYASPGVSAFNIIGNVAMLVPFGLLARPALGWGWIRTTLVAAAFSVGIETLQGLTGRSADIDDVLLNTLGAGAAALASAIVFVVAGWLHRRAEAGDSRPLAPPGLPELGDDLAGAPEPDADYAELPTGQRR
ncbi:MAG: VanZ family protein [Actinomycetales bacterium]